MTLLIGLAGGLGAAARFLLDGWIRRLRPMDFPWATVLINVSGSFALGVLTGLVLYQGGFADLRLIAGTGFCGGYTTFSTASFETVRLVQRRAYGKAIVNGLGTLLLAVGAAAVGLLLTH